MTVRLPGFFDLQVNGFAGLDFNTPGASVERIDQAIAVMQATGVTRFLPTVITSSREHFADCARPLCRSASPAIAGLHMEGPYISPRDGARGAHDLAQVCAASREDFKWRQDAADGRIVLVTLAPEVPGALDLIEYLVSQGIVVAIGHSLANAAEIRAAVSAGATMSTHLGNGCPGMLPRHDNVIWPQLAEDELAAGLIVDGHHLPPPVVKAMVRAKSAGNSFLVTDAMAAAAAPPGPYWLGALAVDHHPGGRVCAPGADNLAGSSLTMDDAVAKTVAYARLSLREAWRMASVIPAGLMGRPVAGVVDAVWLEAEQRLDILAVDPDAQPPEL